MSFESYKVLWATHADFQVKLKSNSSALRLLVKSQILIKRFILLSPIDSRQKIFSSTMPIKDCIKRHVKFALYTGYLGLIQYDEIADIFQPACFTSRLHSTLASLAVIFYIFPAFSYFLWSERLNTSIILFASNMTGIAEMCVLLLTAFIKQQVFQSTSKYCTLLNEHLERLDKILELLQNNQNPGVAPIKNRIKSFEWLFLGFSTACNLVPFLFLPTICVPYEPTHRYFQTFFEVDVSLNLRSLPVLLLIFWIAMDTALVVFLASAVGLFEIMLLPVATEIITPAHVSSMSLSSSHIINYRFNSQLHRDLDEDSVVRNYRYIQVLNCHTNLIYSCLSITSHHAVTMITLVCLAFLCIRTWYILVAVGFSGYVMLGLCLCGMPACLVIEYVECLKIGKIVDATKQFVCNGNALVRRTTRFGKFIRSCPKYLTIRSADPFFLITKETFIQYLDEAMNFLVTLLTL